MKHAVGLGLQDFERIIEEKNFYIDKTRFISEWWNGNDEVTLITRPRRFGKTLMMSTVENFFSIRKKDNRSLFEGLEVSKDDRLMDECGKWPVLFVSFAGIKRSRYEDALIQFNQLFTDIASQLSFLRGNLDPKEREIYDAISDDMDSNLTIKCLSRFTSWLSNYYGKKVILLIDEYDTPMQEAYVNGYWDRIVEFIRNMFNSTLKTNPNLYRAILTGITRVSRESLFSDINNISVFTISTEEYSDCFGFTEDEVFKSLDTYGYSNEKEKVKEWYDGFKFGGTDGIYNPWSILSFLKFGKYEPYWANTSSNSLISKLVREGDVEIKKAFEVLLNDGIIKAKIDEQLVFGEMTNNKKAVWSLLFAGGYLKPVLIEGEGSLAEYNLKLTNHEVKDCFNLLVDRWFENAGENYSYFVKALLEDNIDDMTDSLKEICESMISSFDGSGKSAPENFYHGLVLGLLVELRDSYEVKSNRESGLGRYDVMLRSMDKSKNSVIIEFKSKRRSERDKNLEELADIALKQIKDKKYENELIVSGYDVDKIKKYAFVFDGKELLIKKGER